MRVALFPEPDELDDFADLTRLFVVPGEECEVLCDGERLVER